ncbi:MAG: Cell division protein FtsA [Planctomycetes bacterium]|nr:Cell division protein FtsA [Planctomycetota bacterium]
MFKKQRSLIGLDIGTNSVKAVELTQFGSELVLTAYGQNEIVSEAQRADAVVDLLQGRNFRTRRVVTAVSGKSVIVRYLTMIQMSDDDLKNAIKFEADKYIPFDVDEVVLDAQRLEGAPGAKAGLAENEMRVLLVAVKRSLIEDHVQLVKSIGLQPEIIDVDAFALGNAWELRNQLSPGVEDQERVVALLDVGANKTNINVLRGGSSHFTREIYLGSDDFTSAIAKRMGCEPHQAEQLKRDPGDHFETVRDAVLPSIDDLANEIHLSFDYFENQSDRAVDDVLLSGGGSLLKLVPETFEKVFEKRVRHWDPTENLKVDADAVDVEALRQNAASVAVAAGLAARIRKD